MSEDHLLRHRSLEGLNDKAVRAREELTEGCSQRLSELDAEDARARDDAHNRRQALVARHREEMAELRAGQREELKHMNQTHERELELEALLE